MEKWEAKALVVYSRFHRQILAEQALLSYTQMGYGFLPFPPTHEVDGATVVPLISCTIVKSAFFDSCLSHTIPRFLKAKWNQKCGNTLLFRERAEIQPEYSHQSHYWCIWKPRGWQLYVD